MISDIFTAIKLCIRKILSILFGKYRKLNRLAKLPRYTPGKFTRNGKTIEFPDAASFVFIYRELFIGNIYKFYTPSKRPLIIDCGANMGMSVIYCKEQYPDAEIIAFEPERTVFGYLKKNIDNLGLKDVELVGKAVWNSDTTLLFNNEGSDGSRIASSKDGTVRFNSSYEVEAVRLSNFISREVDFLKLDIEGAEVEVMKEIEPKLRYVKHLFIEYHSYENSVQELDIILRLLTKNNFHYYIDSASRMKQMPFVDNTTYLSFDLFLNIFAIRKG